MGTIPYRGSPKMAPLALACLMAGSTAQATSTSLYLVTEDAPPSNMKAANGQVVGIVTDKIRAIMKRTGTGYTVKIFPWARAYNTARHQANACVFSTTRTPEREAHFKWVGPLHYSEWVLFRRTDHALTLNTLEDARPYLIGAYNGDAQEEYLRKLGFRVDTTFNAKENLRELLSGKIDLWATDRETARILLHKRSTHGKIAPALVFNRVGLYLACNPGVSDKLINEMKAADETIKKDGSARAIEQKYQD